MTSVQPSQPSFEAVEYDPFAEGPAIERIVPSTEAQREIWLACQLGPEASLAYNESVSLSLHGRFDELAVQRAVQALAQRHDSLRASFSADGHDMLIAETPDLVIPVQDLRALDPEQRSVSVQRHIRADVDTPFDLARGPLLRVRLLELADDEVLLVLTAHHIVCDGWSFGVLMRELGVLLAGRSLGEPARYADYAVGERGDEGLRAREADENFWLGVYRELPPPLDLPTDYPRAPQRRFASAREDVELGRGAVDALRALSAAQRSSMFVVLFATFSALLARLCRQRDVVVGISAAAQAAQGLEDLVGHCVHLLPVRLDIGPDMPMDDVIGAARGAVLDALEHQRVSFGSLLQRLQVTREPGRLPLVPVIFNLDARIDPGMFAASGLRAELSSNPRSAENFELYLNVTPHEQGMLLECQYKTELFARDTVRRWLDLYAAALRRIAGDARTLAAAAFAPTEAEQALLARWNDTARPYPSELRLGDLLLQGMARDPQRTALVFEGQELRHVELESRAWAVAHALRGQGVGPGQAVGVCLPRGIDLVTALVGSVFSGGAYVPLDPGLPVARITGMAIDAGVRVLLTSRAEFARIGSELPASCVPLFMDQIDHATAPRRDLPGSADDPVYILFTSGSTGRPKGAVNGHRGVVNRLLWMQEAFELRADERVLQKTPFSFDVSVWEFFWPLSVGATLVVARPDGHRDSAYLAQLVHRERVDVMHFVPSMLQFFLDEPEAARCTGLRQVVCSGEALDRERVEQFFRLFPRTRLANLYGPTEAAVDVSCWHCRAGEASPRVPIGAPIANTQLHVLDEQLRVLPLGAAGELYIGGVQVGLGYVGQPELTAQRFVADPFRPGARLYRTGDLARWRADGVLEYLGRGDDQVKIRGYRIELGEIESRLQALPGVQSAVAMAREDAPGERRLVAYVCGPELEQDTSALRETLREQLPDFMLPQLIVRVERMPLLSSGKVDRRALPAPVASTQARSKVVAPRNEVEARVLRAMESVLKLPGLSVLDDFFGLGGHSLLAARLIARLNGDFELNLPLQSVFDSPSAEALARTVEQAKTGSSERIALRHEPGLRSAALTAQQERIAFVQELHPERVTYNAPSAHRLEGPLDPDEMLRALRLMVQRQPVLRTAIRGDAGVYEQVVEEHVDIDLPLIDLCQLDPASREPELMRRMREIVDRPMDLRVAPLFRCALFRLEPQLHVFLFMPHHIIWDGWSFDLLYDEMAACLEAVVRDQPVSLPVPSVTYCDYARWQHAWMDSAAYGALLEEWTARLSARSAASAALPTDRPRGAGMTGAGASEWVRIDAPTTERLREMARAADVTLNMLTLGLYAAMLSTVCRAPTLTIGVPVRGRLVPELENVMGFFNNLLPLPLEVDRGVDAGAYLRTVKRELVEALKFQEIPFERLAAQPGMLARSSQAGLYQALFSFQDVRERDRRWGALRQSNVLILQSAATEDLGLWLMDVPGGLEGGFNYNVDIYEASTVQALRDLYQQMVARLVAEPRLDMGQLLDVGAYEAAGRLAHLGAPTVPAEPSAAPAQADPTSPLPLGPTARCLAGIWAELLSLPVERIRAEDNFFDLGGDSLGAMEVIARMQRDTGKRANPRVLIFENLTQLAAGYDAMDSASAPAPPTPGLLRRLFGGGR